MKTTAAPNLPARAPRELDRFVKAGVISATDVAAAAGLVRIARGDAAAPDSDLRCRPDPRCWIAMCMAVRAPRDGHTCVPLTEVAEWMEQVYLGEAGTDGQDGEHQRLDWPADAVAWQAVLETAGPLVGGPDDRAPFIVDNGHLYLGRSLHEERQVARRLAALGDRLEILLGGPGTGKTTQVAIRLVDLFRQDPKKRIALAAPTGKAAARMKEALLGRLDDPNAPDEVRNASEEVRESIRAAHPTTIHALIGSRPLGTPRYEFHAKNQLTHELVVVDEASMISSSLMHHLLDAIGDKPRLLLVGDPDQLASVEAGSVLGDMARSAGRPGSTLAGRATTLTVRHRFGPRIGALADAILLGDAGVERAFEILEGRWTYEPDPNNETSDDPASVAWVRPGTDEFRVLMRECVEHARKLRDAAIGGDVATALAAQRELQVLCAHREGNLGVSGRNAFVERELGAAGGPRWYAGRPVLVTVNNRGLGLHNGDVGVVVPVQDSSRMEAVFPVGRDVRRVPVSRLESVGTVHALTIHKSQGTEYRHAIVILPEQPSRIVTRELLYTGVTRASGRVTVVGSREVIEAAIRRPIRRATGLAERLQEG